MILINFYFSSNDKTSSPREAVDNLELTDRHLSVQTHQEREGNQLLYYSKQRKHTSSKLKLCGASKHSRLIRFPSAANCHSESYFPFPFIQSPEFETYLISRYSLKCWPVCFTYKAPSLIRPVPYKWGITVTIIEWVFCSDYWLQCWHIDREWCCRYEVISRQRAD